MNEINKQEKIYKTPLSLRKAIYKYREVHKDELKDKTRDYNREYMRTYYKGYYDANKEKVNERKRELYHLKKQKDVLLFC